MHPGLNRPPCHRAVILPRLQPGNGVHTAVGHIDLVKPCPGCLGHAQKLLPPSGVKVAHPAQVAGEMAIRNEVGQRGRQDQIAKAQGRKQRLREGADIDHPPRAVDAADRRQGAVMALS